eukprot:5427025-Prymnesium_polylepis.1
MAPRRLLDVAAGATPWTLSVSATILDVVASARPLAPATSRDARPLRAIHRQRPWLISSFRKHRPFRHRLQPQRGSIERVADHWLRVHAAPHGRAAAPTPLFSS